MGAEMNLHLVGYLPDPPKPPGQRNERSSACGKTVITDCGSVRVEVFGARDGRCEPILMIGGAMYSSAVRPVRCIRQFSHFRCVPRLSWR